MSAAVTFLVAVVVFVIAAVAGRLVPAAVRAAHPWLPQVIVKTVLVAESLGLMLVARRPLGTFGFRRAEAGAKRSRGLIAAAFGLGALATIVVLAAGLKGLSEVMKGITFAQIVLTVWIYSSVTEEIFTRGWFQSVIAEKVSLRAQVLLSAALFGSMHISLFFAHVDPASAATIVVFTTILGTICATLRARTGSLLPAIWAHIAFNVGGLVGGIIVTVAKKIAR